MPNELYSIDQAAAYLGVSESTVRRRLKAGKLQGEKVKGEYGEQWFIYVQSLQSCKSYEQGQALPTLKELEGMQKSLILATHRTIKEELLAEVSAELWSPLGFSSPARKPYCTPRNRIEKRPKKQGLM